MTKVKQYINLSTGIEYIPDINSDFSFLRIQSTVCEIKHWNTLI